MLINAEIVNSDIHKLMELPIELDEAIINTNNLHYRLQTMYIEFAKALRKETITLNKLVKQRRRYYLGQESPAYYKKYPLNIQVNRQQINKYIEADDLVVEQNGNIDEIESCLKIIEDAKKRLTFRTNDVKVILDYRKFKAGNNF